MPEPASRITFYPESGSALLPIERPPLVDAIAERAVAEGYEEKSEFHVTVLPRGTTDGFSEKQLDCVRSVLQGGVVDDLVIIPELLFQVNKSKVVDGTIYPREALVVRVHSESIVRRLGILARALPIASDAFLHVTLFTRGNNEYARGGIGIVTNSEFEAMRPEPYLL